MNFRKQQQIEETATGGDQEPKQQLHYRYKPSAMCEYLLYSILLMRVEINLFQQKNRLWKAYASPSYLFLLYYIEILDLKNF